MAANVGKLAAGSEPHCMALTPVADAPVGP